MVLYWDFWPLGRYVFFRIPPHRLQVLETQHSQLALCFLSLREV